MVSFGSIAGSLAGLPGVGKVVATAPSYGLSRVYNIPISSIASIQAKAPWDITGAIAGLPGVGGVIAGIPSITSVQVTSIPSVVIPEIVVSPAPPTRPIHVPSSRAEQQPSLVDATGLVSTILPSSQVVQVAPSVVKATTVQVAPSKIVSAVEPTLSLMAKALIERTPELKPIEVTKAAEPTYKAIEVFPVTPVITAAQAAKIRAPWETPAYQIEPSSLAMMIALRARTPELQYTTPGMLLVVEGLKLPESVVKSGDVAQIQKAIEKVYIARPTLRAESATFLTKIAGPEGAKKLIIQAALTEQLGVVGLREERTIGDMLREDLNKHPEWGLSKERTEDLINYYPEIGLSLLAGSCNAGEVNAFFDSMNYVFDPESDVGVTEWSERLALSTLIAKIYNVGGSEGIAQSLVARYIQGLNPKNKERMSEWVTSGTIINDTNKALMLVSPGQTVGTWMSDPTNQLYLTAGSITLGGIGGFALKGLAGVLGGAMMGVFAGTEIPNLSNSNVFASNTIQKLEAAGIKDASVSIGGYKKEYDDVTKDYNDALSRGDLAGADKYAYALQSLGDRYADFVDTNWAAYQKAGILDDTRTAVINQYDVATQNRFTKGTPPKNAGKQNFDGYDAKTDQLSVNGVLLKNYDGSTLQLPPGEYKLEWKRSGYELNSYLTTVTPNGSVTSSPTSELPSFKQAQLAEQNKKIEAVQDPFTLAQKITTVEKEVAYQAGVNYSITWQPGWQVQDPYTLEWKKAGDIKVYGAGATSVMFKDPQGNLRYTRITNNDPSQSSFITGLDSLPFQPTLQVPYQAKEPTGKGYIMFDYVRDPAKKYYVDGMEVTERMVGMATKPGDHSLIITQEGMKPTEVKFTVNDDESNFITFAHVMFPEPQEQEGGGGGGPSGGMQGGVVLQTTIVFGTSLIGARVWLDGIEIAPVIGQAYSILPGYHAVKATKSGFNDWDKTVYCMENQSLNVDAAFVTSPITTTPPTTPPTKPPTTTGKAYVKFTSTVLGASVYINDQLLAVTPDTKYEYDFGYYGIKITKEGKVDWLKNVYLATGDTLTISPIFEDVVPTPPTPPTEPTATTKRVFINTTPAGSKILINNGFTGQWTPGYLDLERGIYKLVTTKIGYIDKTSYIYVGDTIAFGDTALSLARLAGLVIPT